MHNYDVLLLPKCKVAEEATYCWHDVIKNKIQVFADLFLQEWLENTVDIERFQDALEQLLTNLEGFSPMFAAARLAPISSMPEPVRSRLLFGLDNAFRREFDLDTTKARLLEVIGPLRHALQECRTVQSSAALLERLDRLRITAGNARREIESLPGGFLIPRSSLT